MQNPHTEPSAPNESTIKMVREVQASSLALVNSTRCTQIQQYMDYEGIGGKENIEESLLTVVRKFPDGVRNDHLKMVFPEAELAKARTSLVAKGLIIQSGKRGDDVMLKPVMEEAQ